MKSTFFLIVSLLSVSISAQTTCINGLADIYPCSGFDLQSHFTLEELGGGVKGSDCWGWTDENSEREFILYCRSTGLSFVEITDPINPVFTAMLPASGLESTWRDVKVLGNYAYVVSMASDHGLQIIELTQLLSISTFPTVLDETAHYSGFSYAHNFVINEQTHYGYAVDTDGGGLLILDLEYPTSPVLVGSYDAATTHDAQSVVYHGPDLDYLGSEIVFCFNGDNVLIINADDKSDLEVLSDITDSTSWYIHQGSVSEDHRMLYYNDELDEIYGGQNTRTYMADITDLNNPIIVGYYDYGTESIDHNLYVHNEKVYASNNSSGLRVSNILENGAIEPYGFFDTYPLDDAPNSVGTWSNYPFFPSKNIAVSNRDGLFILRASEHYIGINEPITNSITLGLSPNPATSSVRLSGEFTKCDIIILDIRGREILRVNSVLNTNGLHLDVTSLIDGAYCLSIVDSKTGVVKTTERLIISN